MLHLCPIQPCILLFKFLESHPQDHSYQQPTDAGETLGIFKKLINMNCEIVRIYRKKYTKNKIEVMQQINAENVLYKEIKRCKVSCFKVLVEFAVCVDQVLKIKTSAFIRQLSSPLESVIKYSLNTRQVTS
jgi:hypothetical protein